MQTIPRLLDKELKEPGQVTEGNQQQAAVRPSGPVMTVVPNEMQYHVQNQFRTQPVKKV